MVLFSFCSQCGAQVRSDNSFCGQCGTPVPAFNPQGTERPSQHHGPRNSWFSIVALVAIASWIYLSPYLAVWNLKEAARTGNIAALSEEIDFPAFRDSLKSELNGQLAEEIPRNGSTEDRGFALLGSAFAGALVGAVIDQIATPQGFANMAKERGNILDVDPFTRSI